MSGNSYQGTNTYNFTTAALPNHSSTGSVTITGTPTQGQTLTAANTLADIDGLGAISYQWLADGVAISGAINSTLRLEQAQVGKAITVSASYTDSGGAVESKTSTATAAVANVNDLPTGGVTVSGTPTQGQTLTAANTLADLDGLGAVSYQWLADGVAIGGATGTTLVLAQAQVGKAITVRASYIDGFSTAENRTSAATAVVVNVNDAPTGNVSISGTPTQGQTLTAANTLADLDGPGAVSYQWLVDGVAIGGATGTTLVLAQAQVGRVISVSASYTDGFGTAESKVSSGTSLVASSDTQPPIVSSFTPSDAATGVAVASNIVMTFNEAIQPGTGNIVLKTAAGAIVATYDPSARTNLSIAGSVLTINPSADLAVGIHYLIEFAAGSIKDLAGNPYAGTTSYDFTTIGVTGGLAGTAGNDQLQGTAANDTFTTDLGNDIVNAGTGIDTVRLPMFPNVYSLTESPAGHVSGGYAGYTLNLDDVETVQFGTESQTTIPLSVLVSGQAQLQLGRLTDLYLAFFGRAPDVRGLEYWQERLLEEGRDFATISKDFAWSTEAQALFPPAASNRAFVQTVYVNSFGRQPDAGGWDYWSGRLDGLGVTDLNDRGAFVGEVILGAYAPSSGAEDRALLTNRHNAAMYYVNQLSNMPSEGFDAAINTLLAKVTGDTGTEVKAEHVIDYAFAHPVTLTGVMTDPVLLGTIWGA